MCDLMPVFQKVGAYGIAHLSNSTLQLSGPFNFLMQLCIDLHPRFDLVFSYLWYLSAQLRVVDLKVATSSSPHTPPFALWLCLISQQGVDPVPPLDSGPCTCKLLWLKGSYKTGSGAAAVVHRVKNPAVSIVSVRMQV